MPSVEVTARSTQSWPIDAFVANHAHYGTPAILRQVCGDRRSNAPLARAEGPGCRPPVERIRQPFEYGVPPAAHAGAPAVARTEAAMGQRELATLAVRREFEQDRRVQAVEHP